MRRNQRDRELMGDTSCRDVSAARAVGRAVNWGMFGVILLVAFIVALWTTGIPGASLPLFVFGTLIAFLFAAVADPGFWRKLRRFRSDTAPVLPDALSFRDPLVSGLMIRLVRARQARTKAIAESPFGGHHTLVSSQDTVAEVERRALVAMSRAEYARNLLANLPDDLSSNCEVARLREAERTASSGHAGAEYGKAAGWSADGQAAVRRVDRRGAVFIAQGEYLVTILESLPAKMADAELLRIDEADGMIGTDMSEAEDELAELDAPGSAALEQAENRVSARV